MTSIHASVATARQRLRDAGISATESDLDARLLAQHALGWTAERFLTDAHAPAPDGFSVSYDGLIARRTSREPLAYIVGSREFWGLEFEVNASVLIPRPSTELLVESALDLFPDRAASIAVADVCTGSGCVAIAIAHERESATVVASDISTSALEVARRNAARHRVMDRVTFVATDLLGGIDGPFDAIFANPPYVVANAAPALQPEVRDHEPGVAIFGGFDGLEYIRRLVNDAPGRLRMGGFFVFEFGLGQDLEIEEIVHEAHDLTFVDVRRDLQGISRMAIAQRV